MFDINDSQQHYDIKFDDYVKFIIYIAENVEYSMTFKVYEVTSWSYEDEHDPSDMELYMSGYIKWDGCSHVWFGEEDENGTVNGYLHLCGKESWLEHNIVMKEVYALAAETIVHYDKEVAEL